MQLSVMFICVWVCVKEEFCECVCTRTVAVFDCTAEYFYIFGNISCGLSSHYFKYILHPLVLFPSHLFVPKGLT